MKEYPTNVIRSVSFSTFSQEEIRKLSVLEVNETQNFNELFHAVKGGVHDPALGPERDGICSTCNLVKKLCPGHIGHINLPLPVFNPVFIKVLYQILSRFCFKCHKVLCPLPVALLFQAKLKALDYGKLELIQTMDEAVKDYFKEDGNPLATTVEIREILDELFRDAIKGESRSTVLLNAEDGTAHWQLKNLIELRQELIKEFTQEHFKKKIKNCPHCKEPKRTIHLINKERFIVSNLSPIRVATKNSKNKARANAMTEAPDDGENIVMDENENENEAANSNVTSGRTILTPLEARKHVAALWENDKDILEILYKMLSLKNLTSPIDVFFLDKIIVPPPRFRPVNEVQGKKYENPQSIRLTRVIQHCKLISYLIRHIQQEDSIELPENVKLDLNKFPGRSNDEKLNSLWSSLQTQVNGIVDYDPDAVGADKGQTGVKQIIEKKEGLFRKNMMGKRVNFAARSVISPDPYISIEEIGIPDCFAIKLTFPQPVTTFNVKGLQQAVINGPYVHPGANAVERANGTVFSLYKLDKNSRQAIAKTLLTPELEKNLSGCKVVHRHLINGDMVLVNRQPTLHKPSIMAHKVRILYGERTLRLHYSNCKTYNADFDGDEMNVHLPQSEHAKAEAKLIANVNSQYLVPKDGTPLGGLIQDHMISGIRMTIRGKFFTREDYEQIVYHALSSHSGPIKILPPCIIRPAMLWSGKQIISTLLINLIPKEKPLISLTGKAKVDPKLWQNAEKREWLAGGTPMKSELDMSESEFIIQQGELLCGVMDKQHYGPTPHGLIHCCYELYDGMVSNNILSALGKLFSGFIQKHGFSLGAEDILTQRKADKKRARLLKHFQKSGSGIAADALGVDDPTNQKKIYERYVDAHLDRNERNMKALDQTMKSKTNEISTDVNNILMPDGLHKGFPENNLQLMVHCGAKGSLVNCTQISCMLGQIDLEGRRPQPTPSGRTLPSFRPYDVSPRAGGFVSGRFVTGIRPQEYFYHCMAGREGLTDTAVKTSRSGYLQRCLIKHTEGLHVHYDLTVRDNDGSVVQFLYGEDGLDIQKSSFLNYSQMSFLEKNYNAIYNEKEIEILSKYRNEKPVKKIKRTIKKWKNNNKENRVRTSPFYVFSTQFKNTKPKKVLEIWKNLANTEDGQNQVENFCKLAAKCPDPVVSKYQPDREFGSVVEFVDQLIENYLSKCESKLQVSSSQFRNMIYLKSIHSMCEPGEAVGLLAAQSIGEPSTQMTLNTFHFAGRGDMNVTLGIPRMREILMTASKKISTPSMDIPFKKEAVNKADDMKLKMTQVTLSQMIEKTEIAESISISENRHYRTYEVKISFLPRRYYRDRYWTTPSKVLSTVERKFLKKLVSVMNRKFKIVSSMKLVGSGHQNEKSSKDNEEESANHQKNVEESDEEIGEDDDAAETLRKTRFQEEMEYEEPEDEEVQEEDDELDEFLDELDHASVTNSEEALPENEREFEEERRLKGKEAEKDKARRIHMVTESYGCISDYDFDVKKNGWCRIVFTIDLNIPKIDFGSLLKEVSSTVLVHQVPNIKRAVITEERQGTFLKTEGINMQAMFKYDQIFDLNRIYCNNIHEIAETYGIEAASRAIVKEIQDVFQVYGIKVNPRHLTLVADYMTFDGHYRALNRTTMQFCTSPLQQMSFETTMNFLKEATLNGYRDNLKSPSARLIIGNLPNMGTGCFDLIQPLR